MDKKQYIKRPTNAQEKLEREIWASHNAAEYSADILDKFLDYLCPKTEKKEVPNVRS